jgi:hypothetical protein
MCVVFLIWLPEYKEKEAGQSVADGGQQIEPEHPSSPDGELQLPVHTEEWPGTPGAILQQHITLYVNLAVRCVCVCVCQPSIQVNK